MKSRVSMIVAIISGSFCIYCVQDHGQPGSTGPVSRAAAQVVSESGPTMLFDQVVSPTPASGRCLGPEIDISGYTTVVLHRSTNDPFTELKLGEAAGFVRFVPAGPFSNMEVIDGRLGKILRVSWSSGSGGCGSRGVSVAGYRTSGEVVTPPPPGGLAN